jgi:ribokinase
LQNEIPEDVNEAVARRAKERGVMTILNAAPARPFTTALSQLVDILIVNAIEAEMLGGGAVSSLETAAIAAERLGLRFRTVLVTAGGAGVAFFSRAGDRLTLPGIPVVVASTHGAGDAFVGAFAARLALGESSVAALNVANQEAARLVSTPEDRRSVH